MVAIDVVTAEGKQVHCDTAENEELFWLARGGGPGMFKLRNLKKASNLSSAFPGVITRFWLHTMPVKNIFHSTLAWPFTEWSRVMPWAMKVCVPELRVTTIWVSAYSLTR